MIIINISDKLKRNIKSLGYKTHEISDLKTLPQFENFTDELVVIGDKASVRYDSFALKIFLEKNFRFVVEISSDLSRALRYKIAQFQPQAFVRHDVDKIELDLLLQSFTAFKLGAFKGQGMMEHMLNQIPNPVFLKNERGKYSACNDAFCDFVGYSRSELIGRPTSIVTSNKKAFIYDELNKRVFKTGKEIQNESKLILKNESVVSVLVNRSPLYDEDGNTQGIMGVVTDISQQKEKQSQLKKQKQQANESDKLKTSFLSNMSHEIRTPMNAIVGFSQLLGNENITQEKKELYIDQINHNAAQLLKLIEDIIEISKIEAGKVKMNMGVAHVNDILDDLKNTFKAHQARMGKNHIELHLEKEKDKGPFAVISDSYRLKQILTNLLGNSFKFTEEGRVSYGYTLIQIDEDPYIEFFVKDTGIGIKKEKLGYIFDRFSKVPASKTKLYGGTGLGLSISYNLTKMLGGEMNVNSEENVGTKFTFTIPYASADGSSEANIADSDSGDSQETLYWDNRVVYIVEDEEMNYLYLNEILKDKGLQIIWKKNGVEFLEAAQTKLPDLVLMDIKMPKMDGYEATSIFKEKYPDIPVIFQTAYAMKNERKKGFAAGGDQYIEKPVNKKVLLNEIQIFLG
ncbi:MAG: response regulator [Bacteroidota bacterium]|nr:response regulator [Bacteroidota bacterium]